MRQNKRLRYLAVAVSILVAVAVVAFAAAAVLSVPVSGASMEPTLTQGDRLLLSSVNGNGPDRFTVVVGRFTDNGAEYVKRVVGLPGDRISIEKYGDTPGVVRIQPGGTGPWFTVDNPAWRDRGKKVAGNCCTPDGKGAPRPEIQQVPAGKLFVLGDNIGFSDDSRAHGWMPVDLLRGQVRLRVYPLDTVGGIGSDVTLVRAP